MPSTVDEVFAAADLAPEGSVRWATPVPQTAPGVYVVSLTDNRCSTERALGDCPPSADAIAELLDVRHELTVDGERPTARELGGRLAAFWLRDEVVLYIGLAGTSLQSRVSQYYRTSLGARSPHAGGWFLKTLTLLPELHVHYARCTDPDGSENAMLGAFSAGVSEAAAAGLHDPDRPIPFANLEWPKRRYKKHGIKGAKKPRARGAAIARGRSQGTAHPPPQPVSLTASDDTHRTQPVTDADIRGGRIRIPRGPTKQLFPAERTDIEVELRGERFSARWDPRYGPNQERSGVIGVGRERAGRLLDAGEVLSVSVVGEALRIA